MRSLGLRNLVALFIHACLIIVSGTWWGLPLGMSLTMAQCACSHELLTTYTLCSHISEFVLYYILKYIQLNSYWGCGQVFHN